MTFPALFTDNTLVSNKKVFFEFGCLFAYRAKHVGFKESENHSLKYDGFLRTSPPLSFSAMMLGCEDNLIMQSAGKSIPVFAGTLYKITGIGELSATWQKIK